LTNKYGLSKQVRLRGGFCARFFSPDPRLAIGGSLGNIDGILKLIVGSACEAGSNLFG
jgi:hypothetical protein